MALLLLINEVAGIIANLGGGWLATRFGIPRMLLLGIAMQILGLMFLSCLDPTFGPFLSVIWVVVAQGISGLAKDITKTASKSAIKVVKIDEGEGLFRWVCWFTGSKNAMKGVGFSVGNLTTIGFRGGLWLMAGLLGLLAVLVVYPSIRKLGQEFRPNNKGII